MYRNLLIRAGNRKIVQSDQLDTQIDERLGPVRGEGNETRIVGRLLKQTGIARLEENPFLPRQVQPSYIAGGNLVRCLDRAHPRRTMKISSGSDSIVAPPGRK